MATIAYIATMGRVGQVINSLRVNTTDARLMSALSMSTLSEISRKMRPSKPQKVLRTKGTTRCQLLTLVSYGDTTDTK